ncbi:cytochrome c [uncultured Roseovarius sp.]|uniref:c-type cytochrome n=1 Tax=uncultured Roseovarius sp. TaxID=293344 RepID=UPI00261A8087|nr:cytochrome c [uncultured Roseovarius sp.]
MTRIVMFAALVLALAIGVWVVQLPDDKLGNGPEVSSTTGEAIVAVIVPELSGKAALGANAFDGLCAGCHGANAGGIEGKGPPLIHKIYEPGHHGDFAFVRATQQGVRSHHWSFGDMPPVSGATDADIEAIIAYIRTVQRANDIY